MHGINNWEYLTKEEQAVVEWQYQLNGGFFTALWVAICCADTWNLEKLEKSFPIHVGGFRKYREEADWWPTVLKKIAPPKKEEMNGKEGRS